MGKKFPLVRLRQFRDFPPYIFYYVRRLLYLKWWSYRYANKYATFHVLSAQDTLKYVIQNQLSVIRFGDGEYGQLTGAGEYPPDSDWSQRASFSLIRSLKSLMSLQDPRILLAHTPPEIFLATSKEAATHGLIASMHTEARMNIWKYIHPHQVYGHCGLFLPEYNDPFDWKLFFDFLSNKDVVIVTGGTHALPKISFGANVYFVETGKHDAFERRDQILSELHRTISLNHLVAQKTIFMISLGPTAGLVVKQLSDEGFVAWDTGHFFKFAQQHWQSYEKNS